MLRVACEMIPANENPLRPNRTHEGERIEMRYSYGQEGFCCDGCGHFLPGWEAQAAIPTPYRDADGLAWAILDAEPLIVCRPGRLDCEYPRR